MSRSRRRSTSILKRYKENLTHSSTVWPSHNQDGPQRTLRKQRPQSKSKIETTKDTTQQSRNQNRSVPDSRMMCVVENHIFKERRNACEAVYRKVWRQDYWSIVGL